jgi:hypothetical protein
MNETVTLLITTAFLAIGAVGLYMLKSEENDYDYDSKENYDDLEEVLPEEDDYYEETKSRNKGNTRRTRKRVSSSKRRY